MTIKHILLKKHILLIKHILLKHILLNDSNLVGIHTKKKKKDWKGRGKGKRKRKEKEPCRVAGEAQARALPLVKTAL